MRVSPGVPLEDSLGKFLHEFHLVIPAGIPARNFCSSSISEFSRTSTRYFLCRFCEGFPLWFPLETVQRLHGEFPFPTQIPLEIHAFWGLPRCSSRISQEISLGISFGLSFRLSSRRNFQEILQKSPSEDMPRSSYCLHLQEVLLMIPLGVLFGDISTRL